MPSYRVAVSCSSDAYRLQATELGNWLTGKPHRAWVGAWLDDGGDVVVFRHAPPPLNISKYTIRDLEDWRVSINLLNLNLVVFDSYFFQMSFIKTKNNSEHVKIKNMFKKM